MESLNLIDGKLAVRYETTEWSNPVKVTLWWLAERWKLEGDYGNVSEEDLIGVEVSYSPAHFLYTGVVRDGVWINVWIDPQAQAIKEKRDPILPPKTTCEIRYYQGCWEKYLKHSGWVTA